MYALYCFCFTSIAAYNQKAIAAEPSNSVIFYLDSAGKTEPVSSEPLFYSHREPTAPMSTTTTDDDVPGHILVLRLGVFLREACPNAATYPSLWKLRERGHEGVYRMKTIDKRLYLPMDQIPKVIEHFKLNQPEAPASRSAEQLAKLIRLFLEGPDETAAHAQETDSLSVEHREFTETAA
jgi:hypothetical protein